MEEHRHKHYVRRGNGSFASASPDWHQNLWRWSESGCGGHWQPVSSARDVVEGPVAAIEEPAQTSQPGDAERKVGTGRTTCRLRCPRGGRADALVIMPKLRVGQHMDTREDLLRPTLSPASDTQWATTATAFDPRDWSYRVQQNQCFTLACAALLFGPASARVRPA